ncbi:MAG: glycosyltransferase [Solirubrobacterales bacterium]
MEAERRSSGRAPRLLSVVAPACNEESTLEELHRRVAEALSGDEFELVLVDDGSTDRTPAVLDRLETGDPRVRVVTLSRNFGHQAALTAGLDRARGDVARDLRVQPELLSLLPAWGLPFFIMAGYVRQAAILQVAVLPATVIPFFASGTDGLGALPAAVYVITMFGLWLFWIAALATVAARIVDRRRAAPAGHQRPLVSLARP